MDGFVKNIGGDWQGQGLVGKNMFHPDKAKIGDKTILTYYTTPKNGNPLTCPDAATIAIYVKDLPKATQYNLSDSFTDEFFETKKVVHLPLKYKK